jgi:hypothetical protein
MSVLPSNADIRQREWCVRYVPGADIAPSARLQPREGNHGFRIIFFAIPSATVRSESGMNGLLLQPGRDEEGLCAPGSHRVTGWAAISFSSRAASSSRVSPSNTRLLAFRMR